MYETKSFNNKNKRKSHGAYRHDADPAYRRAMKTIVSMNQRCKTPDKWRTYGVVCPFLDIEITDRELSAKWLWQKFGAKPQRYSIEKVGNSYYCGQCEFCQQNNLDCSLVGWVDSSHQANTRSNTILFELDGNKAPLSRLSELIDVPQWVIQRFWYGKLRHILSHKVRAMNLFDALFCKYGLESIKRVQLVKPGEDKTIPKAASEREKSTDENIESEK